MKRLFRRMAVPVALVAGVGVGAMAMQSPEQPVTAVDAQARPEQGAVALAPPAGAVDLAQAFRSASQAALPGVVYVQVEAQTRQATQTSPFEGFGFPFEDFFGQFDSRPRIRRGSGSGFIISPDGYVLTNNHVVENATRVTVAMTDKRQFEATVVGRDPNTDVAVLKIEADNLPTVPLGNSDAVEVGDWVLALGYPLSLGETVTAGIVSAKGRSIDIMRRNEDAVAPLEHFIQTDAAINPGNSGGPLVNLRGEAIGITTAIASPTGIYAGYGFAVPISIAKRVADDLIEHGVVRRPQLGVQIGDVTPADVDVFGLPNANGAVVKGVPEGPARDAGVQLGDVIVGVNGTPITDTGALMENIALRQPGERVTLDIIRYGDRRQIEVRLGSFESTAPVTNTASNRDPDAVGRLGFAVAELTPRIANQLGIQGTDGGGVVITRVDPTGPAPPALVGMRIERINGREVKSIRDVEEAAGSVRAGSTVSIIGRLRDGTQTIVNYRTR